MMRMGWNSSLPLAELSAFTSFTMLLKRSAVSGNSSQDCNSSIFAVNRENTALELGSCNTSALSGAARAAAASKLKMACARSGS